jgi:MFS family permease
MIRDRVVVAICLAQATAQIGTFAVPALLPTFIDVWTLSNAEAGWITGIYYAGYAVCVPVLASFTDRIDAKKVYVASVSLTAAANLGFAMLAEGFWSALLFRALMGIGWAGTYMPGLKALSDHIEGPQQSRAVAAHAAAVGISAALSFVFTGLMAAWLGWRAAVLASAAGAAMSATLVGALVPARSPTLQMATRALLDFRPVFANRSAMAYAVCYMVHTWEMSALRGWVVAFLAYIAAQSSAGPRVLPPTVVATMLGLVGVCASFAGNELSRRFGRRRFIYATLATTIIAASFIGFASALPYAIAATLIMAYAVLIWADSSSLTAGAAGTALPGQRGATLAVHSTLGYAGGFLGPLVLGIVLDASGGESVLGWGLAFGHVAVALALGPLALSMFKPAALAGDTDARHTAR